MTKCFSLLPLLLVSAASCLGGRHCCQQPLATAAWHRGFHSRTAANAKHNSETLSLAQRRAARSSEGQPDAAAPTQLAGSSRAHHHTSAVAAYHQLTCDLAAMSAEMDYTLSPTKAQIIAQKKERLRLQEEQRVLKEKLEQASIGIPLETSLDRSLKVKLQLVHEQELADADSELHHLTEQDLYNDEDDLIDKEFYEHNVPFPDEPSDADLYEMSKEKLESIYREMYAIARGIEHQFTRRAVVAYKLQRVCGLYRKEVRLRSACGDDARCECLTLTPF